VQAVLRAWPRNAGDKEGADLPSEEEPEQG